MPKIISTTVFLFLLTSASYCATGLKNSMGPWYEYGPFVWEHIEHFEIDGNEQWRTFAENPMYPFVIRSGGIYAIGYTDFGSTNLTIKNSNVPFYISYSRCGSLILNNVSHAIITNFPCFYIQMHQASEVFVSFGELQMVVISNSKECSVSLSNVTHGGGMEITDCSNVDITTNSILESGLDGICVRNSNNLSITGNLIKSSYHNGIFLDSCERAEINNNTVNDCREYGILFSSSSHNFVANNNLLYNQKGSYFEEVGSTENQFENNKAEYKAPKWAIYLYLAIGAPIVVAIIVVAMKVEKAYLRKKHSNSS